jgi:tRNA-specific 2-thiouridylase
MSRVFVAMSGGVDSSVAAALLAERGEDVVAVWMRLVPAGHGSDAPRCCGTDEAGEDARRAASVLGIPFYALDYAEVFGRQVVDRFVASYAAGDAQPLRRMQPLREVRGAMPMRREVRGRPLATGHYARLSRGSSPPAARAMRRRTSRTRSTCSASVT